MKKPAEAGSELVIDAGVFQDRIGCELGRTVKGQGDLDSSFAPNFMGTLAVPYENKAVLFK